MLFIHYNSVWRRDRALRKDLELLSWRNGGADINLLSKLYWYRSHLAKPGEQIKRGHEQAHLSLRLTNKPQKLMMKMPEILFGCPCGVVSDVYESSRF